MVMRVMKEDLSNFKGPWWCEVSSWGYQTALHYFGTIGHQSWNRAGFTSQVSKDHSLSMWQEEVAAPRGLDLHADWCSWLLVDWLSVWSVGFCDSAELWCSPTWDSKLVKTLCSFRHVACETATIWIKALAVKTAERTVDFHPQGPVEDPILNRSRTVHRLSFFFLRPSRNSQRSPCAWWFELQSHRCSNDLIYGKWDANGIEMG